MKYEEDETQPHSGQLPDIWGRVLPPLKKRKPITANLIDTHYQVVLEVCSQLDWNIVYERDSKNWDIKWTDSSVTIDMLSRMQSHQKINHFPGMNTLSRKNNLAKNMARMHLAYPQHYDFTPKTFLLPGEAMELRAYSNQERRRGNIKTFIAKPEASCQGRGIFLSQDLSQLEAYGQCVVQQYLDRPLLYKRLKFDMRIYALIAGCDPLRIYIFNEGLVRFATEIYQDVDPTNIDNLYMHLTNYAINKDNPKYVFNQSLENLSFGHKKSVAEFFQTLKGLGLPANEYWTSIKDIIVKTMIAGQPHLQHEYRMAQPHNIENNMCFQVLGFDFMIDQNGKVFLLEINYTPSFSTDTPLDHLIKSNLIRDTMMLMNVTPTARNQALRKAKVELQKRVYSGKINRISQEERQELSNQFQLNRDKWQKAHLGSFERIYPSKRTERQQKYAMLFEHSVESYKQMNSPQRSPPTRKLEQKYRIKRIISNQTIFQQDSKIVKQGRERNHVKVKTAMAEEQDESTDVQDNHRDKILHHQSEHDITPKDIKNTNSSHPKNSLLSSQIKGINLSKLDSRYEHSSLYHRKNRYQLSS